jgi:PLAT/LH2 domain
VRLLRQLRASAAYDVRVVTGSRKGAGTDSRVFVELFGELERHHSCEVALMREAGRPAPFARGATDEFTVRSEDLGGVAAVRIWQDASGSRPHWFLESVHVRPQRKDGANPAAWEDFPAGVWLSTTYGPKRLAVRLERAKTAGVPIRCSVCFAQLGSLSCWHVDEAQMHPGQWFDDCFTGNRLHLLCFHTTTPLADLQA